MAATTRSSKVNGHDLKCAALLFQVSIGGDSKKLSQRKLKNCEDRELKKAFDRYYGAKSSDIQDKYNYLALYKRKTRAAAKALRSAPPQPTPYNLRSRRGATGAQAVPQSSQLSATQPQTGQGANMPPAALLASSIQPQSALPMAPLSPSTPPLSPPVAPLTAQDSQNPAPQNNDTGTSTLALVQGPPPSPMSMDADVEFDVDTASLSPAPSPLQENPLLFDIVEDTWAPPEQMPDDNEVTVEQDPTEQEQEDALYEGWLNIGLADHAFIDPPYYDDHDWIGGNEELEEEHEEAPGYLETLGELIVDTEDVPTEEEREEVPSPGIPQNHDPLPAYESENEEEFDRLSTRAFHEEEEEEERFEVDIAETGFDEEEEEEYDGPRPPTEFLKMSF